MEQTINSRKSRRDNHIKLTVMRQCLIASIRELSDIEYQKREWIDGRVSFYYSLLMISDFLEDIKLYDDPEGRIGVTVRNKEELIRIVGVTEGILRVFDEIGDEKEDGAYWGSDLWDDVVCKAGVAYEYIKAQGLDKRRVEFIERTSKQNNDQSCIQKSEPEAEKGLWDKCTSGLSNIIKTIRSKA